MEEQTLVIGQVGGLVAQMPLSDHSCMVTRFAHQPGRSVHRVEKSPIAGILPTTRPDQAGITVMSEARWACDRNWHKMVETHARYHELVDGRGLDVLAPKEKVLYPRSSTKMQMIFGFFAA